MDFELSSDPRTQDTYIQPIFKETYIRNIHQIHKVHNAINAA